MKVLFLIAALIISGCTTALWAPEYKQEIIDGFYVKSDTGELFVTASDSAYLFEINKSFGEALTLSRKIEFYPSFNDFELKKDNTIVGNVSLTLISDEPSLELETHLLSLGFKKDKLLKRLKLTKKVEGKRFTVEGDLPLEKLEKSQRISIAQPSTFSQTAGKIVATPATIVIDSVVVVPAVFLGATIMAAGGG
ncbi:hypothetical protein J8M21_23650 [Pseudoalteromonas luteoviolacea]|uniref:hypothetical protein n=1 Tax=Pseudoalteromonas luteoviolacea TaxID=43657 RepID=UPI001B39CEBF|nr:hypothetical protein [Pseudoalteromonas luteoviolacea]MBQ4880201.1 hypothetical protein [Pseudoalteromonas luteoviolacea]MBQ4909262.1 hypothetical protein [Pseudoalteromonas luteoviolacea]